MVKGGLGFARDEGGERGKGLVGGYCCWGVWKGLGGGRGKGRGVKGRGDAQGE